MLKHFVLLLNLCTTIYAFSIPTTASVRKITDKYFKIYEPPMTEERFFSPNQHQCLFYTGGNSDIPCEIYSSFLTKLSEQNLTINVVNTDLKKSHTILQSITHNKPTTVIAHSSGSLEALDGKGSLELVCSFS